MDIIPVTPIEPLEAENIVDMFSTDSEIDQLAQTLSPHIALLLLKEFRGATVTVARKMTPDNQLAQKLGFENAQIIADYMGGGRITVPTRHPAHMFVFDFRVKALVEAGLSGPQIATELGISDRQVRRIKSRTGLSGVSYVSKAKTALPAARGVLPPFENHPTPSESVFNGGLTGVLVDFAAPDPSDACFASQCVIQAKYGIYSPQPKKDQS